VDNPRRQPGQSIIKQFLDAANKLNSPQSIQRIWISGHAVIEEDETADEEVKEAVVKLPSWQGTPKYLPMKAALAQHIKNNGKRDWEKSGRKEGLPLSNCGG